MSYWGYHLILDCAGCDPARMSDHTVVDQWIRGLVRDINMEPIGEPRIEFTAGDFPDKAGFTVVQIIVTSSIVAHFIDRDGHIYLDVFSCREFDPRVVRQSMESSFGATRMREYFLTRQAG